MKVLRIILTQNMASYKKEEADQNKMTYPLPPFSTVIGALHKACSYAEYHPMDISISGKYGAVQKEVYRDYAFLNSLQNDRGMLVKLANSDYLSTAFSKVASAKKSQGNDFEKEITIDVLNRELLSEYQNLKQISRDLADYKKTILDPKVKEISANIKGIKENQKEFDKKSEDFLILKEQINKLTLEKENLQNEYNVKKQACDDEYKKFATLTTSIKHCEVLYDVNLILHITSDEDTLNDIYENIDNLVSIGRSEDFVDVKSCEFVSVSCELDEVFCENSSYIKLKNMRNGFIFGTSGEEKYASGTVYYLNKNYEIHDGKRIFNKEKVLYISNFYTDSYDGEKTGIYIDNDGYVVNFV